MRLYLDTAPAIYVVEQVTPFFPVVDARLSAAGIVTHCDVFLTNDHRLDRFPGLPIEVVRLSQWGNREAKIIRTRGASPAEKHDKPAGETLRVKEHED